MSSNLLPRKVSLSGVLCCALCAIAIGALLLRLPHEAAARAASVEPAGVEPAAMSSTILYQEHDPRLVLTGTWQIVQDNEALGGAYLASNDATATLTLTFTGTSIVLYRHMDDSGGRALIEVDGDRYDVSFASSDDRPQTPFVLDRLGSGQHTLVIAPTSSGAEARFVKIDALEVPSSFGAQALQQQALARANFHRQLAKLPLARGRDGLLLGAQAHAEYLAINRGHPSLAGLGAHRQSRELPGFVGITPTDRAAYFGYSYGAGEVVAYVGDPVRGVDAWMETVYHRNLVLCYECNEMGYGMVNDERGRFDVLNMGSQYGEYPAERVIYTYPVDEQGDVPTRWNGAEIPDPLPDVSDWVGYPVSLYLAQPWSWDDVAAAAPFGDNFLPQRQESAQWEVLTATLRDDQGQIVPTYLLDQATDPHGALSADVIFLIPHQPLQHGTTYHAEMSGIDSRGVPFEQTWRFTTRAAELPEGLFADVSACAATISWVTGEGVTGLVRFGTQANDDWQEIAAESQTLPVDGVLYHLARLVDLRPDVRYSYEIVTENAQGQRYTTPVASFTTSSPRLLTVPSDNTEALEDALRDARACDIVQVAAGTYTGSFLVPRGVQLVGAGAGQSILQGTQGSVLDLFGDNLVSGFTIQGSGASYWDAGIFLNSPNGTLRDNHIQNNENGIVLYCFDVPCAGKVTLQNNTIVHNRHQGIYIGTGVDLPEIINNTLHANRVGLVNDGTGANIRNNIIVQHQEDGIRAYANGETLTVAYNNLWENEENTDDVTLGEGNQSLNPHFVDPDQGNYTLAPGSPLIDAGDPNPLYTDGDGTRNDMGATGGAGTGPVLSQLEILASPLNPLPGERTHFTVRFVNTGRTAEAVRLQIAFPATMQPLAESFEASQGSVERQGQTLVWEVGAAYYTLPLTLDFAAEAGGDVAVPAHARLMVTLSWEGGERTQEYVTIVGGQLLRAPYLTR